MEKWRNKYRIQSARLKDYDYASNGAYFITICSYNQTHFFGECNEGLMKLSTVGAIVQGFWYDIPNHFPFITLDKFVVMPNHIHGILIVNNTVEETLQTLETLQCNVSTVLKNKLFADISPKTGSISTVIRSYKSVCSKHIHLAFPELNFNWQSRFYDHIIRDESAYQRIADYIVNNPLLWEKDKFYLP
jgi:REP element-mobilizing transposase RayT